MARAIVRSPRAERDLVEIWLYIAADDSNAADRLLDRIASVLSVLAENPFAGRARDELHAGIRSFAVGNYVLFYRVTETAIDVVRVRSRYLDTTADHLD